MNKQQESFFYSDIQEQQHYHSFQQIHSIIQEQERNKKTIENISQKRKRGRPRKQKPLPIHEQHFQQIIKIIINRYNYHKIYFQMCQKIEILQYSPLNSYESSLYQWAFIEIIEQLRYRQSQQKSMNTTKLRSLIIRKVIQDFMKGTYPQFSKKQSQRISSADKKYYEQAKIQVPPSVLNSQYILNLFKNKYFKVFYTQYLKENKVRQHFLRKCYDQVLQFCQQICQIGQCLYDNERKQSQFKKLKKPMTLLQVKQLQQQAYTIYSQYCQ